MSSIVPGTGGGAPVVTLGLLQALSGLGYDLRFILDERASLDPASLQGLATAIVPHRRKATLRALPRNASRLLSEGFTPKWNPVVWDHISREVREYSPELVVLDTLRVAEYGRLLKEQGFAGRVVLHEHNVEYGLKERELQLARGFGKRLELRYRIRKLKRIECSLSKYIDACLALTTVDRDWLARLNPGVPVHFVPPALDLNYYRTQQPVPSSKSILFIGGYRWPPNHDGMHWFVNEVWPRVRAAEPEATLFALGRHPPDWLKQAPGVTATGFVEDERPYYESARAAIAPLRFGSGVRVKILQSLAMARPMISTTIGAEGIPIVSEESIMIADDPESFAAAILRVLRDDAFASRLAQQGRAVCERWYSSEAVERELSQVIDEAVPPA